MPLNQQVKEGVNVLMGGELILITKGKLDCSYTMEIIKSMSGIQEIFSSIS